jgi:hypothetical protein
VLDSVETARRAVLADEEGWFIYDRVSRASLYVRLTPPTVIARQILQCGADVAIRIVEPSRSAQIALGFLTALLLQRRRLRGWWSTGNAGNRATVF